MRTLSNLAHVIAFLAVAGGPALGQSPKIRVCDDTGCSLRSADEVPPDPAEKLAAVQEDRDIYRGESEQQLQSAYRSGDATAAYKLGQLAQFGIGGRRGDPSAAAKYYEFAAARGHVWAQFRLATLLTAGASGVAPDPRRATELFFAAAKEGHPQSANNIAIAYFRGVGLPQNVREAMTWFNVAAEAGIPEAQMNLGLINLRGDGGAHNLWDGFRWTKAAAERGQPSAQKSLGRIYMTGLDTIRPNLDEAERWLQPIAASGDREARQWLSDIHARQAQQRETARQQEAQAAETFKFLAGVAMAAILAPPPTYILVQ